MSQQGRQKPLGPERLPDVQPPRTPRGYGQFLPGPPARPTEHAIGPDEPAWWEEGSRTALPDAPRWRAGSHIAERIPPPASTLGGGWLFEEPVDHGDLHRRELVDDLRSMSRPEPMTTPETGGGQRRADRDQARRERRKRRREEREAGSSPGSQSTSRRDRPKRRRDVNQDWDNEG